jgi:hypothetical protein
MSDKPKRSWFQLHLSTLIVITFAAAGMSYVDVKMWTAVAKDMNVPGIPWDGIIMLALIEVGILAGVTYLCEAPIRRREARKT